MPENTKILVIDDDRDLRYSLRRVLVAQGYEVAEADSGEAALQTVTDYRPHIMLLDNRMEGMSGIETLQHLRTKHPDGLAILMTGYGTTQTTIEAMKYGAFDYVMKPFDPAKIIALVSRAAVSLEEQEKTRAAVEADRATETPDIRKRTESIELESTQAGIIGNSEAMQTVIKTIGQVAASDVTVLITGESGTGKELVARCLHQHSLRSREKFHAVNCAAIPENLIESELFGHEKGAFTGASAQKPGKFELCDKGTIFLDEIGDMALATQTKILRALQEGEIQRVGGTENIKVNVRLVAATNKDLEKMVAEKTFREDLYYRLNVVRLRLPPLRQRKEDIPLLVEFMFHRLAARKLKHRVVRLSPEALERLRQYNWPGNVRELENVIQRAIIVARGETVMTGDLPPEIADLPPPTSPPAPPVLSAQTPCADAPLAPPRADFLERHAAPPVQAGNPAPSAACPVHPASSPHASWRTVLKFPNLPETDPVEDALFDQLYAHLRQRNATNLAARIEDQLILRALTETKGNQLKAASLIGLNRNTLKKRIDELSSPPSP
ncbi:MAG: sigma-54 dependent transcriptional regulator [Puniceicoccales bacterium]|jgi:two-component system nitrogen regulation response regulator GlnG|nr:sigma-54 dependent transcriptional regulator [Puniceicoccales bacterium]